MNNSCEYQVTEWEHPKSKINSQWGKVDYEAWCQLECNRWKDKWRESWVVINKEGLIALFTHSYYQAATLED